MHLSFAMQQESCISILNQNPNHSSFANIYVDFLLTCNFLKLNNYVMIVKRIQFVLIEWTEIERKRVLQQIRTSIIQFLLIVMAK